MQCDRLDNLPRQPPEPENVGGHCGMAATEDLAFSLVQSFSLRSHLLQYSLVLRVESRGHDQFAPVMQQSCSEAIVNHSLIGTLVYRKALRIARGSQTVFPDVLHVSIT